jgi:antitoxin PrlF
MNRQNMVSLQNGEKANLGRSSIISSKGQIILPLEVRKRLGLRTGDRVEFVVENGQTTIRPARAPENPFLKYVGVRPVFPNAKKGNAWVRSLRDSDSEDE